MKTSEKFLEEIKNKINSFNNVSDIECKLEVVEEDYINENGINFVKGYYLYIFFLISDSGNIVDGEKFIPLVFNYDDKGKILSREIFNEIKILSKMYPSNNLYGAKYSI